MTPQVYLAGPYTAPNSLGHWRHCSNATETALRLVRFGAYPVASHLLGLVCQDGGGQDPQWWYDATLEQMQRCDAVLMLEGWQGSDGAINEHRVAQEMGLPVFFSIRELRTWVIKRTAKPFDPCADRELMDDAESAVFKEELK